MSNVAKRKAKLPEKRSGDSIAAKPEWMFWFKYIPSEVAARTEDLTLEERGAFHLLRDRMWNAPDRSGSLPYHEQFLARVLRVEVKRFRAIRKALCEGPVPLFVISEGRLFDPHLTDALRLAREKSWKASASAKQRKGPRLSGRAATAQRSVSERSAKFERLSSASSTSARRTKRKKKRRVSEREADQSTSEKTSEATAPSQISDKQYLFYASEMRKFSEYAKKRGLVPETDDFDTEIMAKVHVTWDWWIKQQEIFAAKHARDCDEDRGAETEKQEG